MVLDPIVGALAVVFAPFFALINFIGFLINKGFGFVVSLLTPVIETLQSVMTAAFGVLQGAFEVAIGLVETAIATLETAIETVIGTLQDALEIAIGLVTDAIDGLWTALIAILDDVIAALLALAEDAAELILGILDFLFVLLLDSIELIIALITAAVFWIWDAVGLPDLLALLDLFLTYVVDIVAGIPDFIVTMMEFVALIGSFIFVLWFGWAFFLPVLSFDIGEMVSEWINRCFANIFPWDLLGFHIYIPQGLVMLPLLYFVVLAPSGGIFAIW